MKELCQEKMNLLFMIGLGTHALGFTLFIIIAQLGNTLTT